MGGLQFVLRPGTAYAACICGSSSCGCGTTCCDGFTEFCCVLNRGYNYCPNGTVMGGWWKAEGSVYCNGPRYYMDCHATCKCQNGCGGGFPFCSPGCDGATCDCALGSCGNYVTSCFQFRYGQCNQEVACMGRIVCRVVTCVPPWEIDPTCTTANAQDDSTANQNAGCLTPGPTPPPKPPEAPMPATITFNGQYHVFDVDPSGVLIHRFYDPRVAGTSWNKELLASGCDPSRGPTVTDTFNPGELHVFADRPDGSQIHFWIMPPGSWSWEVI